MSKLRAPVAGAAGSGRAGTRALRSTAAVVCGAAALALLGAPSGAAAADSCANAEIRAVQGATHLPDCRAYEWVSSDNPGGNLAGVDVALRPSAGYTRADGNRMLFFGTAPFGDADRGPVQVYHFAERTEQGWSARPAIAPTSPDTVVDSLFMTQADIFPSADLSSFGFSIARTLGPPNPVIDPPASLYVSAGAGRERWISRTDPGIEPVPVMGSVVGGSADLSTVYFIVDRRLTAQAGDDLRNQYGIYEERNGVVRPAGVLPDGRVAPGGVALAGFGGSFGGAEITSVENMVKRRNQVSEDGRRLFFVTEVGGAQQLYVREDGSQTRLLSPALGAPATPSAQGVADFGGPGTAVGSGFAFATPDGSRVLFRSRDVLAAGAQSAPADAMKTYRAEVATGELTYLPDVNGSPIALDEDASRVVFVEETADGEGYRLRALRLWDEAAGATHVIDPSRRYDTGFEIAWIEPTAGGSTWTLQSSQPLDPAFPDTDRRTQVYRWTIGDRAPSCISCRSGATYTGNANLTSFSTASSSTGTNDPAFRMQIAPRVVSSDGRRVFFDTPTALVDADANDERDVYVWEEGRGVALLSGGTGRNPSFFLDASENGDDVVITTPAGLDPADLDESYDVYNVRVGGGFAVVPPATCTGDGCQPPPRGWIAPLPPASDLFRPAERGPDVFERAPARIGARRVARDRTGATLRITASSPGVVRVTGRRVASVRRTVARKGALTVRLRLRRAARRALARRGKLRVTVRVRFVPSTGTAVTTTVKTTIKRKR